MANAVILLGKSGTGKSSSIKGLDPKETVILNVLGKNYLLKVVVVYIIKKIRIYSG